MVISRQLEVETCMSSERQPIRRGLGAHRFNHLMKQRPSQKLNEGDFLIYEHALRCLCMRCGSLLDWTCPEDVSFTETECCGMRYRLQPWTVKVHVEDVSSRPLLPAMEGSNYADPNFSLKEQAIGNGAVDEVYTRPLSAAQKDLDWSLLSTDCASSKPRRRCGVCRKPGHDRRHCPET